MRTVLCLARIAALGIAAAAATLSAASAKTAAACKNEYVADKDAIAASGQAMKDFIAACRAGRQVAPTPAATAAPSVDPSEKPTANANAEDLAKAAQNPIANMISVPFQSNTNFNVGPFNKTQEVVNIQPVIPFHLTDDWNVITRWVTPLIYQPQLSPGSSGEFGLGNITPSFFFSPANPGKIIWGVGPVFYLPTATGDTLGVNRWGAGPTVVVLTSDGPWLYGVLANNIWAGAGSVRVNSLLVQPFINYNMPGGWFLTSSPIITANWVAPQSNRWLVPIGGGFGRVFKIDKQPVNISAQAYYNVVRPTGSPDWTLRLSIALLFPS
jgi:hypothetical protein